MTEVNKKKAATIVPMALILFVVFFSGCVSETRMLTITASAGGTTNPLPGAYPYPMGSVVSVTALVVLPNYIFDHWELDGVDVGATNPISVTMDLDHALHAVFTLPPTTWRVRMRYYVKDDSDPWIKGDGEWYFNIVATTVPVFTGRAPSSGWWTAVEGSTYDKTLATMTTQIPTFSVSITVMEVDDTDPDDNLGSKTFQVTGADLTQTWNTGYFDSTVYITKIG